MKRFNVLLSIISTSILAAQTPSIEQIRDNVILKFSQIKDYQVDVKISIKIPLIAFIPHEVLVSL